MGWKEDSVYKSEQSYQYSITYMVHIQKWDIMINTLLTLYAVVACTIAAPVIQSCTISPNLYAYCNKSISDTELKYSSQMLYEESDYMTDVLETVCNKTVIACSVVRTS